MPNYNKKEIQEAIDNIRELKTIMNKKQQILKPAILSKGFVTMLLSGSLLLLLTTIITAIGYSLNDSFWNFSLLFKALIIISLILNIIQIVIRKIITINKNSDINIFKTLGDFYTIHIILLFSLSVLFCVLFAFITNIYWIYLPIITIIYGLIVISISDKSIGIIEFRYMGYITILIGILSMLFIQVPILLLALAMYSLILFIYYLILSFARKSNI